MLLSPWVDFVLANAPPKTGRLHIALAVSVSSFTKVAIGIVLAYPNCMGTLKAIPQGTTSAADSGLRVELNLLFLRQFSMTERQ